MFKLQSHVPVPKQRRSDGAKPGEVKAFEAFMVAYRNAHGCKLQLKHFDRESRIAVFEGPSFSLAHTARRCKELTKQLKFRKV